MPLSAEDRAHYQTELAVLRERYRHVDNQVTLSGFGTIVGAAGLVGTIFRVPDILRYSSVLIIVGLVSVVALVDRRRYREELRGQIARGEKALRDF